MVFKNLQAPARQDGNSYPRQAMATSNDFSSKVVGPGHWPGPMECITHGLLQELQTCPPFAAVPACLPTVYLDLDDRDCHDTCKNLYFFVAFPCSVLTI